MNVVVHWRRCIYPENKIKSGVHLEGMDVKSAGTRFMPWHLIARKYITGYEADMKAK